MQFVCGQFNLDLTRPHVMGIVNVTPDSFSDGGKFADTQRAIAHALSLVEQGADILDIGGESTRPGAAPVSLDEELSRVIPVIAGLAKQINVPISIDTYKPEVMKAAIDAGASIVNDVYALRMGNAVEVVGKSTAGVCLMHMQGTPQTMQQEPQYDDVVSDVSAFLEARMRLAEAAGIDKSRILLDPGFGFGKRTAHNLTLVNALPAIAALGQPLLVGLSRKSILGQLVGAQVDERLHASIAASVIAVMKGASIVRVHDVKPTVDALKVVHSVLQA